MLIYQVKGQPAATTVYDPEAEIVCQIEEAVENLCQAIKRSTRRAEFSALLAALLAVKEAEDVARQR
jgi:hypothetical protein